MSSVTISEGAGESAIHARMTDTVRLTELNHCGTGACYENTEVPRMVQLWYGSLIWGTYGRVCTDAMKRTTSPIEQ